MTKKITINEFKKFIPSIRCKHILTELPVEKIDETCKFFLKKITKTNEIKILSECKIVWYKDNNNNNVSWNTPEAINLNIKEEATIYQNEYKSNGVKTLLDKIRKELHGEINIIIVHDVLSNTKMIVEGVHRSIVLYHLYLYERKRLNELLKSKYSINIIIVKTKIGSQLFPYDFINIYRLRK